MVHKQCIHRPGIIDIQSGSDNTGAEANINHGFSTSEILADIIKLVSLKQIQYNTLLNIHHIPGEKNVDADDLSRGKTARFPEDSQIRFPLEDLFDLSPFPKYINPQVQWDSDLHPMAKNFLFDFCFGFHFDQFYHLDFCQVFNFSTLLQPFDVNPICLLFLFATQRCCL